MSSVLSSYPWLTFQLDLADPRTTPAHFWLLIGGIQAKLQQVIRAPMAPELAAEFSQVSMVRGALATTAIEGNTLTFEQARGVAEDTLRLPPSKAYLGQDIDNVLAAFHLIAQQLADGGGTPVTPQMLHTWNAIVLAGLSVAAEVQPGRLRQHTVRVGSYLCPPPDALPALVQRLCDWLNTGFTPMRGYELAFGALKAVLAHLYLAWIHPYGDGNGRTARLLEFQMMLAEGVPAVSAHLLSNFYNETRAEYYRQLHLSSNALEDLRGQWSFTLYAMQGLADALDEQLNMLSAQNLRALWRDYVYTMFRQADGTDKTKARRRRLLLDLTDATLSAGSTTNDLDVNARRPPILKQHLPQLTTRLAAEYARVGPRTLQRDLNALREMGLLLQDRTSVVPNLDILAGFMPLHFGKARARR